MSKSSFLNVRLPPEMRGELEIFAKQIGIPASTLVYASIRQMLFSREVFFTNRSFAEDAEAAAKAAAHIAATKLQDQPSRSAVIIHDKERVSAYYDRVLGPMPPGWRRLEY